MANHDWTRERVALLRQLWDEGLTATEIGRRMGLNKNQVVGKAHREGFPRRQPCNAYHASVKPTTDQQREIVRDLWATASFARITQCTGLGQRRVKDVARELGLPQRDPSLAHLLSASAQRKSRGVVSRPAARNLELPRFDTRAASPSRPSAAFVSGVASSAVERQASSRPERDLPGAVVEAPPRRVFSGTKCQYLYGDDRRAYRFCDAPCVARDSGAASPYCADHYALCLIPLPKAEAARKAQRAADTAAGRMRWQAPSAWR
jgi:GcrA cell cycle regulator